MLTTVNAIGTRIAVRVNQKPVMCVDPIELTVVCHKHEGASQRLNIVGVST